jgi:hypothetical protein
VVLQVACLGEVKAVFWAKGVENIYFEDPETHYQVLESMEGYWIGEGEYRISRSVLIFILLQGMEQGVFQGWGFWVFSGSWYFGM